MITNFKNNKENSLINYLFSRVNTDIGFTKEQSAHLKEDIKQNSIITFITSDFSNYDGNDNLVGKTIKCFKNINIEFKKVSENEIVVSAKNKKDAMNKARGLFNSDLKDIDINNITKYYYVIEINNKEMLVKVNNGKI